MADQPLIVLGWANDRLTSTSFRFNEIVLLILCGGSRDCLDIKFMTYL